MWHVTATHDLAPMSFVANSSSALHRSDAPVWLSARMASCVLLALQLSGLIAVGWPAARLGYPLDDSWIFSVLARNVAQHHSWGYNPDVATSGATSLGWTALLAFNTRFLGLSPLTFSHGLNALSFGVLGQLILRLALRAEASVARALALAVLFCVPGNVLWLVWSGMEPVLFLTLVTAAVLCMPAVASASRLLASGVPTGLLLGAAAALRPDSVAAACVLLAGCALDPRTRRLALTALGLVLAIYAANLLFNLLLTGSPLPVTLQGRKWLEELPEHGLAPLPRMAAYFMVRCLHLGANLLLLKDAPIAVFMALVALTAVLIAVGVAHSLREIDARWSNGSGRLGHLVLFSLAHSFTYLVLFPSVGQGGRYQPFALALFGPLTFIGIERLAGSSARPLLWRVRRPAQALLLCVCALSWPAWRSCLRQGIAVIDATHRDIARRVAQLPPSARVGSFDIGAIGYFAGRPIVDLGGLVDRAYQPYMWSRTVDTYLLEQHVEYIVLPEYYAKPPAQPSANYFYRRVDEEMPETPSFGERLGISKSALLGLEEIAAASAPRELWAYPALLTGVALPRQILYRVQPRAAVLHR